MHSGKGPATDPWFQDFLHTTRPLNAMLQPLNTGSVQVIYTRIDRDARNVPHFHDFFYQVDPDRYFYPASTVKLPMAAAALEKINERALPVMDAGTPYITDTPPLDDGYQAGRAYSVVTDIENMLTLSSNTAFNRLYELVGPSALRQMLTAKGYPTAEIRHPLGMTQPGPLDFSARNRLTLADLHLLLRSIIFPEAVTFDQRFRLTDADHAMLLHCLGQWPREMQVALPDNYAKFLLPDGHPAMLRSFNKAGWAFGFLTDTAYIVDLEHRVEYCLSATIAVHHEGTMTPDTITHETVGKPFLKALGKALYAYELERSRKYYPDLQRYAIV